MENWKRKITKLVKPTEKIKSGQHLVSSDFYLEALCIWEFNATKAKTTLFLRLTYLEKVIKKASAQSKSYNWFEMSATDIEKS